LERIDKIIASQGIYSRSDVKALISKKRVAVDGETVKSSNIKVDPEKSVITIDGRELTVKKNVYIILNKPKGYVSATEDRDHQTVLELMPADFAGRDLFPTGGLDRNNTGLMSITNNGGLAPNILAPKRHVR
jgi:16S rRNA pseudouridine516 synthase